MRTCLQLALLLIGLPGFLPAAETWPAALASIPIPAGAGELNRSNFISVVTAAFRARGPARAIVFLPGVTDDFYLVHRGEPLGLRATNVWDALAGLTNHSEVRLTFREPMVLVHLERDQREPVLTAANSVKERWQTARLPEGRFVDRGWASLQPELEKGLGRRIAPKSKAEAADHVSRINLVGSGLTDWEWLEAVSLASRTRVIVSRNRALFERIARSERAN
jgi:hypothetical protein